MVDRLFYDPILVDEAAKFARNILANREKVRTRKPKLVEKLLEGNPLGRYLLFVRLRKNVLKTTSGHYPAPLAARSTQFKRWWESHTPRPPGSRAMSWEVGSNRDLEKPDPRLLPR